MWQLDPTVLVLERGSSKQQVIRLRSEETIVGRRQGSDLRIPSEQVSRRHCRLSFRDGILLVEDLASSNGTLPVRRLAIMLMLGGTPPGVARSGFPVLER